MMNQTFKKLVIGISMAVGASAIASTPAHAGSLTGATIEGTAPYLTYGVNGQNTVKVDNTSANLQAALNGNSKAPGGNVELFSNSEESPLSPTSNATLLQRFQALKGFLDYDKATTLSGEIGGKTISLSSLTAKDWFGEAFSTVSTQLANAFKITNSNPITQLNQQLFALNTAINPLYNGNNLATTWFNDALSSYGISSNQTFFNTFLLAGGFQRFSDPNISYVNQDDSTGLISIGLAGHYDAKSLFLASVNEILANPLTSTADKDWAKLAQSTILKNSDPLQASEVVKVAYNGDPAQYLYGFKATESGLVSNDGTNSHNGNYEVTLKGIAPVAKAPAPEPEAQKPAPEPEELASATVPKEPALTPPDVVAKSVPEPSAMLGIFGVAAIFTTRRKLKKLSRER